MKKVAYEVDDSGFIKEVLIVEFDKDGNPIEELRENIIIISPPDGLYRAKWTGDEWIEGKTQSKFEEDAFVESLTPSEEEIANAEFEIKILNILMEVELL